MNKRIFITGANGFIGSHLLEYLANFPEVETLSLIDDLYLGPYLKNRIVDFNPTHVIHFAAATDVNQSFINPKRFFETNVIGTLNLLDIVRELNIQKFIYCSTEEVYGQQITKPHVEGEPHRPENPYAASKAAAEDLCYSYWKSFGVPIVLDNSMCNFGERQPKHKLIPTIIRSILQDLPIKVYCRTEAQETIVANRYWIHASDHSKGICFLLDNGVPGERYNIVGQRADILEIVHLIEKIMSKRGQIEMSPYYNDHPGHYLNSGLDGTKMEKMGWKPSLTLSQGLERTVDWMITNAR